MKSKKAVSLMQKVLNIIIAVLVILLLVYFMYKLWTMEDVTKRKQAEEVLKQLKAKIDAIISGEAQQTAITIQGPKDWGIVFYSATEERPQACKNVEGETCFCICEQEEIVHGQGEPIEGILIGEATKLNNLLEFECVKYNVCDKFKGYFEILGARKYDGIREQFNDYLIVLTFYADEGYKQTRILTKNAYPFYHIPIELSITYLADEKKVRFGEESNSLKLGQKEFAEGKTALD